MTSTLATVLKSMTMSLALVWGIGFSTPALAWWNPDFAYRKEVTVDATAASIQDTVQNFPVLLRLDTSKFAFDDVRPDGADIRFVAEDDHTVLAHTLESFDPKAGLAMIWVTVPSVSADGRGRFWMYFGSAKAAPAGSAQPVLDPQFRGVYHFAAGEPSARDATPNHNDISAQIPRVPALIGSGASFDGATTLALPSSSSLAVDPAQGFTFEAWVKPRQTQLSATFYANQSSSSGVLIGLENGIPFVQVTDKGGVHKTDPVAALAAAWTHIAVVGDTRSVILYVNGQAASTLQVPLPPLAGGGSLGGATGTAAQGFAGEVDEVRFSATARAAAYIKASYAAASPGSQLIRLGPTQHPADSGFGYFGVVFKNVTIDAWVVIVILCLMGLVSWVVMGRKASYVGRTANANTAFLAYFDRLKGDLLGLDARTDLTERDRRDLQHSSLYRIYKVAVAEVGARREEGWFINEEALEAIRASLDAAQVEEVQALDRGVVLLTIAIAGAPFIGLLGTVLGVMITFAAIAASGEVNVTSIAPGIAAALLATVTGLAVAIPALFGYNYISTRNTDVSAKMQIFADRLITRIAELQRRVATPRAVA